MKTILSMLLVLFFSKIGIAQNIRCTGKTNDANASEQANFQLNIGYDQNPLFRNFPPTYKASIKYFYTSYTSYTGIDIADSVSSKREKLTFFGSIREKRNLSFSYSDDGSLKLATMNYDSRIVNQPVQCEVSGILPPRPSCANGDTNNGLLQAIKLENLDAIETAIECGANVNLADSKGCTPLMFAIESTCGVENGMNYISAFSKVSKILDVLTSNGAFVNVVDKNGESPLIKAARLNVSDVYNTFIALEADFDAQDSKGNTPLIYAAYNGDPRTAEQILEGNPNRSIKNNVGSTAYDIAKYFQRNDVLDLVRIPDTQLAIEGNSDGTCSPLEISFKQGQVLELTLKATEKMFKLEIPGLNFDIMAERGSSIKKTILLSSKGKFSFKCGFHGSNSTSTGSITIQ